jgi:serine phosphatase RsbU (regulator of sigma subunit)/ligand-binding sensor domain-containing protein
LLKRIGYLFLVVFIISNKSYCQKGDYFIHNYLPKDYLAGANNLGIAQNNEGLIFVANINGVLIFDGVNWQHCKRKDEISIQCIAKTSSGKIVVGTEDGDIAFIEKDKNGKFYYASLIGNLPVKSRPQQIIRQIVVLGESTFFLSSDKLIELKNSEFKVYSPTENFHTRAFVLGKHLFVTDINNAINVLENGVLKPVAESQELSNEKNFFCYKISSLEYILGYRNIGTYVAHYDSIYPTKTTFEKRESQCDKELVAAEINNGCILQNGHFVVTTNKKGAYEIDKQLNIVGRFNSKNGVNDDNIKYAFQDLNGNLWLSLYYGIGVVEINSKLFKYDRKNNIQGTLNSATYFQNKLFIAIDKSVQYYDSLEEKFLTFQNFNKQTWNLLNYNNKLFICSDKGLFVYFNNQISQISEIKTTCILNDPYQQNLIYCGTENGVEVYHVDLKEVTYIKSYDLSSPIRSIASDETKNIYFASENNGIYFLNYSNSYLLDSIKQKDGLPNQNIENCVFTFKNKLLIGTDSGVYCIKKINQTKFKCVPHPVLWPLTKGTEIFRASQLVNDLICSQKYSIPQTDKTIERVIYFESNQNSFNLNTSILNRLKDVKANLITYDSLNKVAFICTDEGLFILNNKKINLNKKFNLLVSEFKTNKDTILENYINNQSEKLEIKIPYENNDITIKIGFTSYENKDFEFCHMLVGKDKTFNQWNKETKLTFNNLREGNYTLVIKAKTELSSKQYELKLFFEILPPWYRSIWAYIIYVVLFILFLIFIIKLNSKRLIAQNKKLENTITERTSTIENQKQELEHKQKEIIDSINYAQRIQRALLASKLLLDENLKNISQNRDYFIFFQPKDIVSGDFYWASKLTHSNFTIAIADSTGHGVPGAIMSMLNISCLKEAVIAQKLINPNEILNYTRTKIIETLANDGSAEGGKDGMDCSLLNFDLTANTLTYSSANNPIWIIKNNSELIELKADKMPVGKHDRDSVSFTQETIQLQKGDLVYASTDGMPDQFGGPKGKKFMYKQLKELLIQISSKPLNEQASIIKEEFNNWKNELEQVDDVLVFGLRV